MPIDITQDKIKSFIVTFVRKPDLDIDEDLFASGLVNSLFAMQLVLFVEKEFGIKIENDDLEISNFRTIGAVAELVQRKAAAGAAAADAAA